MDEVKEEEEYTSNLSFINKKCIGLYIIIKQLAVLSIETELAVHNKLFCPWEMFKSLSENTSELVAAHWPQLTDHWQVTTRWC